MIILLSVIGNSKTLNEALSLFNKKHIEIGKENLTKNLGAKGEKKLYHTLALSFRGNKYELEIINPSTLVEFSNKRKIIASMIAKSYQDQPTPYQGVITNTSKCPKKFTPENTSQKIDGKEVFVIKSFVGVNFNFGICEDRLIAYSACTAFYFDEKKSQYFKLKIFSKPAEDCTKVSFKFFEQLTDL